MNSDEEMKDLNSHTDGDDSHNNDYDVSGVNNSNSSSPNNKRKATTHGNSGDNSSTRSNINSANTINVSSPDGNNGIVSNATIQHTDPSDVAMGVIGYLRDNSDYISDNVDQNNLNSVLSTESNNAANTTLETLVVNLVENFYSRYTEGYLSGMVNHIEFSQNGVEKEEDKIVVANNVIQDDFRDFIHSTNYMDSNPQVIDTINNYLLRSLKRKITRIINRRNIINELKKKENVEIDFKHILGRFNSETILFSIAEKKPDYDEIEGALGNDAYDTNGYVTPNLKNSITQEMRKYLSDMYTAGSGIDGSHDAETVEILSLLQLNNPSNTDLNQIINRMTCMHSHRQPDRQSHSFNPKKAINDLEKLIADVESYLRSSKIPFIQERREYVPLELYHQNTNIIMLARENINTVLESGRTFGINIFEIITGCFDAGSRTIREDQWIPSKLYKIENVYGVNYMFIADAEHKKNHVFACIDDDAKELSYWNYYVIKGAVSLNDVLDIFHKNGVEDFEPARRGDCTQGKGYSDQAREICGQYNINNSFVLKKVESDHLWNHFTNGSTDKSTLGSLLPELEKCKRTNLFQDKPRLAKLLFFSLKGVGDASVESFYQEEVIKGTIQNLLDERVMEPFTNIKQINTISTLNTVDSFLERLIRLAYLCGKIDHSPPRIRPVAGGCIVTSGGGSISGDQLEIIKNMNNLLKYVLRIEYIGDRRKYLMQQFGLDNLSSFIDIGATTSDPTMKTIIHPVLKELYDNRITKLDTWLGEVHGSTYDNIDESLKVNLDNLLSLSGDIGSILNEYDEYTDDILKIRSSRDENVLFEEEDDDELMEEENVKGKFSPGEVAQGTKARRYIRVIVNKEEDSFILELPNDTHNKRINRIIENFKEETDSDAYVADDVLGLVKINGKSCLKFKSSIELFINMYRRFKDVQVHDLCSDRRSDARGSEALKFFTNIIVERLKKYSTKDYDELLHLVQDALQGTSGGGKNMTRKKRLTKKRLKRKRITNKKNKKPRSMKFTKKKNKKSKKHKTYKKM